MRLFQRTFIPFVLTTVLSVVGGLGVALAPRQPPGCIWNSTSKCRSASRLRARTVRRRRR